MRFLVTTLLLLCWLTPAYAEELPARKAGLWEVEMSLGDGMGKRTMKQCVDAATDKQLIEQGQQFGKEKCTKNELSKRGNEYIQVAECKFAGRAMKSESVFRGDFQKEYFVEIKTSFDPPLPNVPAQATTIKGKHVGDCPAGHMPGETVMDDGTKINPLK